MKPPEILHLVSRREITDQQTFARCQRAWASWSCLYDRGVCPVHVWDSKDARTAKTVGSSRSLPFLKDILRSGLKKASNPYDILLFTNDDNLLHPMIEPEVRRHCSLYHCGSLRRVELDMKPEELPPIWAPPIAFLSVGMPHVGRDAFVFLAGWLAANMDLIPDFILGAWGWDICVAQIVRLVRGVQTRNVNELYDTIEGCELPDGLVMHQTHKAAWTSGDWANHPENAHNRKLYQTWCKTMNVTEVTAKAVEEHKTFPMAAVVRHWKYIEKCGLSYSEVWKRL